MAEFLAGLLQRKLSAVILLLVGSMPTDDVLSSFVNECIAIATSAEKYEVGKECCRMSLRQTPSL